MRSSATCRAKGGRTSAPLASKTPRDVQVGPASALGLAPGEAAHVDVRADDGLRPRGREVEVVDAQPHGEAGRGEGRGEGGAGLGLAQPDRRGLALARLRGALLVVRREVAGARPHAQAGTPRHPQLDPAEAAVALRVRRLVGHQVVGLVVGQHPAQAGVGLVGAVDEEAPGVVGQRRERLPEELDGLAVDVPLQPRGHARPRRARVAAGEGEAAAVERVDDRARPRGRVDHAPERLRLVAPGARAKKEAVRHDEADLPARKVGDAAQHIGHRVQRGTREARGLGQDRLGLALGLARSRSLLGVVIDAARAGHSTDPLSLDGRARPGVVDAARLGDQRASGDPQRGRVPAQDHLGLGRSHRGAPCGADEGVAADERLDGLLQLRAVGGEPPDAAGRACRDERDPVVGLDGLGHEPLECRLRVLQVVRCDVQVVDDEDDGAPRPLGDARREGRRRSSRDRRAGGRGATDEEEVGQALGLAVLE